MKLLKRLFTISALLMLAACGGGGGGTPFGGTPPGGGTGGGGGGDPGGGGGVTGSPTVTLALSSSTITQQSPATLTVTVRNASGNPVAGSVVTLRTQRTDIGQLSVDSVLTDGNGSGTLALRAALPGVVGADEIVATANLGTTTISNRIGFAATAASATINATISSTTLRGSGGPATLTAIVRDAGGNPVPGAIVGFGSAGGLVTLSVASALTDTAGAASTQVRPADASVGVADSVVASVSLNGSVFQSSVNVQVIAESPSIALTLTSGSATQANPTSVTATVRDAANNPVRDAVVAFSTQFNLGSYSAPTALTGADGTATVTLAPREASTNGADVAVATVTLGNVTRSATRPLEFRASAGGGEPTLQVNVAPTLITPTTPATVTLNLRNGQGNPVRDAVISLTTLRGNLSALGATSVLTDANGSATVVLRTTATTAGADEVVANVNLGGVALQGRAGFAVQPAAAPSIVLGPKNQAVSTTVPITLQATVLRADGSPAIGQVVDFSAAAGLARLNATRSITDTAGVARITVTPLVPSTNGTDVVTATAALENRTVQDQANVTLVAQAPRIELNPAAGSSNIASAASPATLRVVVRDLSDNLVPNALVEFSSALNLAAFNPTTAVTNAQGEATTVVVPRLPTSAGSDLISAAVTVADVTTSDTLSVSFVGAAPTGNATLTLELPDPPSISAAVPAAVTVRLRDAVGNPIRSQVVTFEVVRGLAVTNVPTALTNANGEAQVFLSPATAVAAGADEITATVSYAGVTLQQTGGFQVQATQVDLTGFTSNIPPGERLSAYGQATLTLSIQGASVTSPVNISVTSSCAAQGKAVLSPANFTATSETATIQLRDNGCGAIQGSDQLLAVVTSTGASRPLSVRIESPTVSSIGFVSAEPEVIYIRGVGLPESSFVTFEVRDAAGQPLPNVVVELRLTTGAGDVKMEDRGVESINPLSANPFTQESDAQGRVRVRVNSGTQPTSVRIHARLRPTDPTAPIVSSVSSNLSIAVGLPSQLNFSLSQGTRNIEGYNIDGTVNTYSVIAADRSGNPLPDGTSINFITREGGQVEAIRQTETVNGLSRATANFVSASPRPVDGRITVVAYALGEESFIDLNGNNVYDPPGSMNLPAGPVRNAGEPFQDLGNIYVDRRYNGTFDPLLDEFIPLNINNASACAAVSSLSDAYAAILGLNANIPSAPATCSGGWSGAGQVYVRRALETVLSTSAARPLWPKGGSGGLDASCLASEVRLQVGSEPTQTDRFYAADNRSASNNTWYGGPGTGGTFRLVVADANPGLPKPESQWTGLPVTPGGPPTFNPLADYEIFPRLNPMAAGSTITATTPTPGLTVTLGGGTPVPSTTEATGTTVVYTFTDPAVPAGTIFVNFTSPSGTGTTIVVPVVRGAAPSSCPVN